MYEHTQSGKVIVIFMGLSGLTMALILLLGGADLRQDPLGRWIVMGTLGILVVAGVMFSSLTITVGEGKLAWRFGPGLLRKSVPLSTIAQVEPAKPSALFGWGIRWTPSGWLYNVSGLTAVRIRLRDGKQFFLGTDEPERLIDAIHEESRNSP